LNGCIAVYARDDWAPRTPRGRTGPGGRLDRFGDL